MSTSGTKSEVVLALAEEFLERCRQGERPSLREYVERHPELAAEIREVFPALALMENIALAGESAAEGPPAPAAPEAVPLQQLGDYRLIRPVGHGGMGIVYEAEQVSLGRHVALKVLPRQMLADARHRSRFEREARAAAKLHHTNIVPVFGVGEHAGMPYYVMQFIHGLGLDQVLKELKRLRVGGEPRSAPADTRRAGGKEVSAADMALSLLTGRFEPAAADSDQGPSPPEAPASHAGEESSAANSTARMGDILSGSSVVLPGRSEVGGQRKAKPPTYWQSVAQIGVQVASALEYAHQQGVLHRDIKPSNLLLDRRGTVWVTDFGLAKADDQPNLTHTGDVLGTLRYMPPEAFEGRSEARSDVYSLGLTLYELLAFRPAFDETDRHKLLKQVTTEPPRLERLNREVPRDLVTIVHKAIDRDPRQRYATAGELAADLQRYAADEPIKARPLSPSERLARWGRRNPMIAGLVAAVILVTAVGFLATLWQMQLARKQAEYARHLLYASDMNGVRQAWEEGNLTRARELLERQRPQPGTEDLRGFEWRYLWRLCQDDSLQPFRGHTGGVTAARFSPDGKMVASASQDGSVRLWDVAGRRAIGTLEGHKAEVTSLAFAPDGKLATAGNDGRVILWDVALRQPVKNLPQEEGYKVIAFSPDGGILASIGEEGPNGSITLWDTKLWQKVGPPLKNPNWICVAFSPPDGKILAVGSEDSTVRLWDRTTWKEIPPLRGHSAWVIGLAFSPDGKRLASASKDGTVKLWDLSTRKWVHTLQGHMAPVDSLAFSPDGKTLVTGSGDSTIKLWDTATWQEVRTLRGHTAPVSAVEFSPDGKTLVTGSWDSTVRLWDIATQGEPNPLVGHKASVSSLAFSPDGKTLASTGYYDQTVKLWDIASRRQVDELKGRQGEVPFSVTFSPDGRTLASAFMVWGDEGGKVRLWDVAARRELAPITSKDKAGVRHIAFSADSKMLAAGEWYGTVRLWDIETRREATPLPGRRPVFAPDGKTLAVGSTDGTIQLWDLSTGQTVATMKGHAAKQVVGYRLAHADIGIGGLAFSPDSRMLASAGGDLTVRLWDLTTRPEVREVAPLTGHTDWIWSLAFAPDGKTVATCSRDGTVKLWNVTVRAEVATLKGHRGQVLAVAFAPDGNLLATAGADGTIRLWRAAPFTETDAPPRSSPAAPESER